MPPTSPGNLPLRGAGGQPPGSGTTSSSPSSPHRRPYCGGSIPAMLRRGSHPHVLPPLPPPRGEVQPTRSWTEGPHPQPVDRGSVPPGAATARTARGRGSGGELRDPAPPGGSGGSVWFLAWSGTGTGGAPGDAPGRAGHGPAVSPHELRSTRRSPRVHRSGRVGGVGELCVENSRG